MLTLRDKIRGFFLGTGIGDSLGMPVEGWTPSRIKETFGRITTYQEPRGHKYHDGMRAGDTTDDTSLTLAVAEAIIEAKGLDLDIIAKYHVKAYKTNTKGWGTTTRESIEKLANGIHWKESGVFEANVKKPKGFGNGVAMKAGPIGLFLAMKTKNWLSILEKAVDFTGMTHRTSMGVSSCFAQVWAVYRCLLSQPETFDVPLFITSACNASARGRKYFDETLVDDITDKFKTLKIGRATEDIIKLYGGGNYYVYNSLPFTYAFFVNGPTNIEMLYECVSNGGDTDSNGSMLGGLLGALNGESIFPKHLIDGLIEKEKILEAADKFYENLQ